MNTTFEARTLPIVTCLELVWWRGWSPRTSPLKRWTQLLWPHSFHNDLFWTSLMARLIASHSSFETMNTTSEAGLVCSWTPVTCLMCMSGSRGWEVSWLRFCPLAWFSGLVGSWVCWMWSQEARIWGKNVWGRFQLSSALWVITASPTVWSSCGCT